MTSYIFLAEIITVPYNIPFFDEVLALFEVPTIEDEGNQKLDNVPLVVMGWYELVLHFVQLDSLLEVCQTLIVQ